MSWPKYQQTRLQTQTHTPAWPGRKGELLHPRMGGANEAQVSRNRWGRAGQSTETWALLLLFAILWPLSGPKHQLFTSYLFLCSLTVVSYFPPSSVPYVNQHLSVLQLFPPFFLQLLLFPPSIYCSSELNSLCVREVSKFFMWIATSRSH